MTQQLAPRVTQKILVERHLEQLPQTLPKGDMDEGHSPRASLTRSFSSLVPHHHLGHFICSIKPIFQRTKCHRHFSRDIVWLTLQKAKITDDLAEQSLRNAKSLWKAGLTPKGVRGRRREPQPVGAGGRGPQQTPSGNPVTRGPVPASTQVPACVSGANSQDSLGLYIWKCRGGVQRGMFPQPQVSQMEPRTMVAGHHVATVPRLSPY